MAEHRVGHTGITWLPYFEPEQAVREVAALGYQGFETFGLALEEYERNRGGFGRLLKQHDIQLVAAYLFSPLIDSDTAEQDIVRNVAWAKLVKVLGGEVVVIGATEQHGKEFSSSDYAGMVRTLNEIGRRCLDLGVRACFHPHTGTPVETREQIDIVLGQVDPRYVFFAPDTGQIQKGGSDPIEVIQTYLPQVKHVHLKDFSGDAIEFDLAGNEIDRTGYLNYVPLGEGVVDLAGIISLLDRAGYDGWLNVELDGTEQAPRPAIEAAAISKRYLELLLGESITRDERHGACGSV
jgi:inosose dehydratase